MKLDEEKFFDIKGYEGLYQVSTMGRIKSLSRKDMRGRCINEIILKPYRDGDLGYVAVSLLKNGVSKRFKVHRLVASAFIPKQEDKDQVNHKNGIKNDNRIINLEWVTSSENRRHALDVLKVKSSGGHKNKLGVLHHCSKLVKATHLNNGEIRFFGSAAEAARELNIGSGSVPRVCNGTYKSSKGWRFEYVG